jgi:hypothetical protein
MGPEINDHVIKPPVAIILATIKFELEIIEGANLLILNSYYWIIYGIFLLLLN